MAAMKRNVLIYILIVLIPALFSTYFFAQIIYHKKNHEDLHEVQRVASLHQNQMDQLLNQTVISLETLSLAMGDQLNEKENLTDTLKKIAGKDPRYGGLYYASMDGKIIAGSNGSLEFYNVQKEDYFLSAFLTGETIISDHTELINDHLSVVSIATPIFKKGKMAGMLIGQIRTDYLKNIMKMLTPHQNINVMNSSGEIILELKDGQSKLSNQWFSKPLEHASWYIQVNKDARQTVLANYYVICFFILSIIIFNLVYFIYSIGRKKKILKLEKQQNDAQKLELVGTLAASTAHEIRNPLTGIKGLIQLLAEKHTDPRDDYYFMVIQNEIERINQIVSEFLILGKPSLQKIEIVDMRDILLDLNPIIRSEANLHNIDYHYEMEVSPIEVQCSIDQMKQVILNLTKNALESMKNRGSLTIKIFIQNRTCCLTIEDTGSGIRPSNMNKIFDPFYTSKDHGTGLGLVVCKRIIQSFQGSIDLDSRFGKGTKVSILLPLAINGEKSDEEKFQEANFHINENADC
ncbi:PAS domain-containing sensor histidine kinase [Falsibacillus albus]|uniref:histidine kinase n=1 Tax=Falsibacillus albus TaxID=2478915 RepID=A0A3L7K4V3_9BACI|nr:PAS domain-containing sensor histidine kinase [Falsibacillus albus]RLQ97101.1 two-component sensor histidine kinase [Falsibacillus albus]